MQEEENTTRNAAPLTGSGSASALPNAGVGLRFETEKRSNVRVDHGVGAKSSAFHVTFYEAF